MSGLLRGPRARISGTTATLEPDTDVRGKYVCRGSQQGAGHADRGSGVAGRSQRPVGALLRGPGTAGQHAQRRGQRQYTEHEVERVQFLQRLYAAGLSSRTIAELLPCVDAPSEVHSDAALERMAQERDRLTEHIADLVRTRDALNALMTAAREYRDAQFA